MTAGHFVVGGNTPFILQIDAENRVAFRTARSLEAGVVRVEDGRICMQYDGYLSNFWLCGAVYRTAAISRGAGADYVYVRPDDLLFPDFVLGRPPICVGRHDVELAILKMGFCTEVELAVDDAPALRIDIDHDPAVLGYAFRAETAILGGVGNRA